MSERHARRSHRPRRGALACVLVATLGLANPLRAQQATAQFARNDSLTLRSASSRGSSVLGRLVSLHLADVTIEAALREVAAQAPLRLSYSSDILPSDRRVSLDRTRITAGEAIDEILKETALDIVVSPAGYVIVVRSPWRSPMPGGGGNDAGRERLPSVDNSRLRPSLRTQLMDRILVMGSPAAGIAERSLASAVSVVTGTQLQQLGLQRLEDLFRSGIPGIVSWDLGVAGPFGQIGAVRGSSSFTANYLKTYVDGVELASPYLLFAIDPYSIERIEIIRGPQGSALYGSDAISGVVQIITRRGTPAAKWRPHGDASLSAGRMESRYVDGSNATQRHSAMLYTGGGMTSLGLGGTYERVGAVIPGSESGYRGTFAGGRTFLGPVRVDGTARYAELRFTAASNPLLNTASPAAQQSALAWLPPLEPQRIEHETYGLTADWQPGESFRQTLVLGLDRHAGSIPPQREPAAVADLLLGATQERVSKQSLRWSMMARLLAVGTTRLSATVGAEHSLFERERLGTRGVVLGTANLDGKSADAFTSLYFDRVRNTGLFGQLKLDVYESLFLTAGLRGERNSSFGENFGTAYSPMIGAAWTHDLPRGATLKLRTAYGKGLRPPPPIARRALQTAGYRQLANPDLQPEVQSGIEGGVELYAGDVATLSFTAYTQAADGLVQQVFPQPREASRTIQYQNVGRIDNRGIEMEGNVRLGRWRGDLAFAFTDSRVKALTPSYTGELRPGDRVPEVPRVSGSAAFTLEAGPARLSTGASHIGSWIGYDWIGIYDAGSSSPTLRDYWVRYPSITKPFVALAWTLGRGAEGYVRIDNVTNLQRYERDDLLITQGRTARLGLRLGR